MNPCCYIVGAGELAKDDLPFALKPEDWLIAADGGYKACLAKGMQPHLLVGDFDSMTKPEADCPVMCLPIEKDDTDLAYCIKQGLAKGYNRFEIFGGLGGTRLSHTIGNIQLLTYIASHKGKGVLRQGSTCVQVLQEKEKVHFDHTQQGICSVFALSPTATVSLTGLQYSITNQTISAAFPLGVSNHFIGQPATITLHAGELLLITETES